MAENRDRHVSIASNYTDDDSLQYSTSSQILPIYSLPMELILDITDRLPLQSFINFAFAHYPLLCRYGLVPAMSVSQLSQLIRQSRLPSLFRLVPLPPELILQTLRFLSPRDTMNFVLANYKHMAVTGIAPPLTDATINSLRSACNEH